MTFDILLIALAGLVLSNVVLLVAMARSGAVRRNWPGDRSIVERDAADPAPPERPTLRTRPTVSAGQTDVAIPPEPRPAGVYGPLGAPKPDRAWTPTHRRTPEHRLTPALPASDPELAVIVQPTTGHPRAAPVPSAAAGPIARRGSAAAAHRAVPAGLPAEATRSVPVPPSEPAPPATSAPTAKRPPGRPASTTRPDRAGRGESATETGGDTKSARGRRFTLPSIEVDHARTERVMLSLLTGDDEAPAGEMVDAWERLVGVGADGGAHRVAVVVALTLDGLDRVSETAGRDAAERLVGAALDAIRRSARASDRVASVGRGHFRVLLVDADDTVAARFVGRVRESADRRLAMAASPVHVAAGWAEASSAGHLEGAVHAAEDHRRADSVVGRRRTGRRNPA